MEGKHVRYRKNIENMDKQKKKRKEKKKSPTTHF